MFFPMFFPRILKGPVNVIFACLMVIFCGQGHVSKNSGARGAFTDSFFNILYCTFSWCTIKFSLFTGTFPLSAGTIWSIVHYATAKSCRVIKLS